MSLRSRSGNSRNVDYSSGRLSPFFSPMQRRRIQTSSNNVSAPSSNSAKFGQIQRSMSQPIHHTTSLNQEPLKSYGSVNEIEMDVPESELKSTTYQTICNAINLLLGVGVLSLPFALKMSGWIIGVGILVGLTALTNYTAKLIGQMIQRIRENHNDPNGIYGFEDMGFAAFERRGQIFISVVFIVELGSACALYLVLMGDNLHAIFPQMNETWLIIISSAIILPTIWLKNLAWLSYFSILGCIASMFLVCVILIQGASTPDQLTGSSTGSYIVPSNTVIYSSIDQWPICFGLIMVGFAGHACFPSLYTGMKDTNKFGHVLNITYGVVGVVYTLLAALGYLMYGSDTKQEVTLNLSRTSVLSQIATWLIVVNPATKFALTLHPVAIAVADMLYNCVEKKGSTFLDNKDRTVDLVVRTVLTIFITIISLSVPYFARIVSFVGAFCSFTVSGTFPLVCYERIFRDTIPLWQLWVNRLLTLFCLIGAGWGTAATFYVNTS